MKEKLRNSSLEDCIEWVHFGLTSEDINNVAYGLILSDAVGEVMYPKMQELTERFAEFGSNYSDVPILARTHGQPASPTTMGKEFKVFHERLKRQLHNISDQELLVKLNGATGNYNALNVAFPEVSWKGFTEEFVKMLNNNRQIRLSPNFHTTQIESRDSYIELFDSIKRFNNILVDFTQDIWRYISDGWIVKKPAEGEVGSSTMPHKVNPINFENAEGNLGIANALFEFYARKLPVSRLQRDLSDSTVARTYGVAFGHSLLSYKSTLRGLKTLSVNERKVKEDLENHPEVISEAIQTVLRREGIKMPYEKLKGLTQGKKVTMDTFELFINQMNISQTIKAELRAITPLNYLGLAEELAKD